MKLQFSTNQLNKYVLIRQTRMFSLYKCVFEGLMELIESLSEQNNSIRRISNLSVRKIFKIIVHIKCCLVKCY